MGPYTGEHSKSVARKDPLPLDISTASLRCEQAVSNSCLQAGGAGVPFKVGTARCKLCKGQVSLVVPQFGKAHCTEIAAV